MNQEEQKVQDCFREVFSSGPGQRVLGQLLVDAGYFDTNLTTPEEIAVLNYAKSILKNCGLLQVGNVDSYVRQLFNIPVTRSK